jgi:hypothetical protein
MNFYENPNVATVGQNDIQICIWPSCPTGY